jgi:hypothetical protein
MASIIKLVSVEKEQAYSLLFFIKFLARRCFTNNLESNVII